MMKTIYTSRYEYLKAWYIREFPNSNAQLTVPYSLEEMEAAAADVKVRVKTCPILTELVGEWLAKGRRDLIKKSADFIVSGEDKATINGMRGLIANVHPDHPVVYYETINQVTLFYTCDTNTIIERFSAFSEKHVVDLPEVVQRKMLTLRFRKLLKHIHTRNNARIKNTVATTVPLTEIPLIEIPVELPSIQTAISFVTQFADGWSDRPVQTVIKELTGIFTKGGTSAELVASAWKDALRLQDVELILTE